MSPRDNEQALHLLSTYDQSDSSSLHSFGSSSSTLASPPTSPTDDTEKGLGLLLQERELPPLPLHTTTTSALPQRPSWRRTPLTIRGIASLTKHHVTPLLIALVPSFLRRPTSSPTKRKLHPTSYLDGLRGVAALIVFIDHFVINWYEFLKFGYGVNADNMYMLQLPIIRLLFSGRASVAVFFVISGFVLSYKPLKQMRSRDFEGFASTIASSVFRRGMRLYLPILFGTFGSMVLAYNGWYMPVPARSELIPPRFETLGNQTEHWMRSIEEITFMFRAVDPNSPYSPPYNGHLWTIPIEFYGSVVVFLMLVGVSRIRVAWRLWIVGMCAVWGLRCMRWDVFLFLSGTFLCEVNFITSSASSLSSSTMEGEAEQEWKVAELPYASESYYSQPRTRSQILISHIHALAHSHPVRTTTYLATRAFHRLRTPFNLLLIIISLYLLSYPGDGFTPGVYHAPLQLLVPESYTAIWYGHERLYLSLGAFILVFSLMNSKCLQKPFTTPLAQYLGDISYSLYIVHGPVLFTLGTHMQEYWTGQVGESRYTVNEGWEYVVRPELQPEEYGMGRYGRAFLGAGVLNCLMVFWVADLFWRGVDGRVVSWGRAVEGWVGDRKGR